MFDIRIDVPNQNKMLQIRIRCTKSEWAVPALEHRSKKLQSVNFSKVKSVFRGEVQNQNREFQNSIDCFKSKQDFPNQDRMLQIRIYVLNQGASNQNSVPKKCSKSG